MPNLRGPWAHRGECFPVSPSSEVKVQPELDDAIGKRGLADGSETRATLTPSRREISCRWIRIWFRELRVVGQVEEVCREDKSGLFSCRNPEILLQGKVEVVNAGIANVRKKPRGVAKSFGYVTTKIRSRS